MSARRLGVAPLIRTVVRRPIAVSMVILAIGILSALASRQLPITLLPALKDVRLRVAVRYDGTAAGEMDQSVGVPLDRSLRAIRTASRVTTQSRDGITEASIEFPSGTDVRTAWLDTREAVERARASLPALADRPVVSREGDAASTVRTLALTSVDSGRLDPAIVAAIAQELEAVPGVAAVRVAGVVGSVVSVELRPDVMAQYGIRIEDVRAALAGGAVEAGTGNIVAGHRRIPVRVSAQLTSVEDIRALPLTPERPGAALLRLGDIAEVERRARSREGVTRLNGLPAVALVIQADVSASAFDVADRIDRAVVELESRFPSLRLANVEDPTALLQLAAAGLVQDILLGGCLAILVLFCFLADGRDAAVIAIVVPASLALTLLLFRVLGLSLNLMTLGGLALGAGMITDAAIVVVSSVAQARQDGADRWQAAVSGVSRTALPILGSTATTVVVFAPGAFVAGPGGTLLKDVALATTCALGSSVLAAIVLVPTLCAQLPSRSPWNPRLVRGVRARLDHALDMWLGIHERLVALGLARPRLTAMLVAAVCGFVGAGLMMLPASPLPSTDTGYVRVRLQGRPDASAVSIAEASMRAERMLAGDPDVALVLARVGLTDGESATADPGRVEESRLLLRLRSGIADAQAVERFRNRLRGLFDGTIEVVAGPDGSIESLIGANGPDFAVSLHAADDAIARRAADMLALRMRETSALRDVSVPTAGTSSALAFHRDDGVAGALGLSSDAVALTLQAATRGVPAGTIAEGASVVPIVLRLGKPGGLSSDPASLPLGEGLRLGAVGTFEREVSPALIRREDGRIVQWIVADAAGSRSAARAALHSAILDMPNGIAFTVDGVDGDVARTIRDMSLAVLVAVLLMYAVLAVEFESLRLPFIVLVSVPLGAAGAVAMMWVCGVTLNAVSLIGLLMLTGIVDNDAVMKLDAITRARSEGAHLEAALARASRERLRPIVVNSLTAAFGVLPVALGLGVGSQLQAPLALVLIGGLVTSTLFAPAAVCVLYALLEGGSKKASPSLQDFAVMASHDRDLGTVLPVPVLPTASVRCVEALSES